MRAGGEHAGEQMRTGNEPHTWGRRAIVVDTAMAIVLYGLFCFTVWIFADLLAPMYRWTGWLGYLTGAVMVLPLAIRRRAPLSVLAVVTAAMVAFQLMNGGGFAAMLAMALAIYTAGAYGRRPVETVLRASAIGAVLGAMLFAQLSDPYLLAPLSITTFLNIVPNALLLAVASLLGDQWRLRRDRERDLAARTAELEAERERNARQAATEERLRIARDLHGVVSSHVGEMGAHAASARETLTSDARRAEHALAAVEATSRQAGTEMQRVLAFLRDDGDGTDTGRDGAAQRSAGTEQP